MTLEEMLELSNSEGIVVEYCDFSPPLNGLYWSSPILYPVIMLGKHLQDNHQQLRCVFAEELGHHFTTVGQCVPKQFYNYGARLATSKAEFKAMRWAVSYLIPEDDLLDVIGSGLYESWELADYFNVTEEFAVFRLRLFIMKHHDYAASRDNLSRLGNEIHFVTKLFK